MEGVEWENVVAYDFKLDVDPFSLKGKKKTHCNNTETFS